MALTDLLYGVPSQTAIGAITLDVLLSEQVHLPSLVTEYPVEAGGSITDDIIAQSRRLMISGSVATSSMATFTANQNSNNSTGKARLQDAKTALEAIYYARTPVTIVTGLDIYPNYAMTSCEMTRAGDGQATFMDIRAEFVQITTVSNQTTTLPNTSNAAPAVAKHASPTQQTVGQVTGGAPTTPQYQSAANAMAKYFGAIQ